MKDKKEKDDDKFGFMGDIIKELFKNLLISNLSSVPLDNVLYPTNEIKIPYFEVMENNEKINLVFEMPGALEEDISFSILDIDNKKYFELSTVDSLGEKYKAVLTIPKNFKKAIKNHFVNGILEVILS